MYGSAIALDPAGYAFVVGTTSSPNWVSGGYDTTPFTESDGFLARIRIDSGPPMPGITATPTYSLVTSEYGAMDEFTVVLNTQPAGDVTLGITSLDPTEGTVFPSTDELTFTSANWDVPQTVIVAGEDDQEVDSDIVYAVQVAVVGTDDPLYQNLDPVSVSVTNLDNESPYEFTSQDVPQEIADPHPKQGLRPAVSELFIADTHIIVGTVDVDVVIEHEYMYGLTATITSPTNAYEDLVYASGIWRVEDQTAFAGISLDGTWTLTITDHFKNGATGTLNSWSLMVTPAAAGSGSSHALPPTAVASPTDAADHIASFRKVDSPRVRSTEGPISSDRLQLLLRSETKNSRTVDSRRSSRADQICTSRIPRPSILPWRNSRRACSTASSRRCWPRTGTRDCDVSMKRRRPQNDHGRRSTALEKRIRQIKLLNPNSKGTTHEREKFSLPPQRNSWVNFFSGSAPRL